MNPSELRRSKWIYFLLFAIITMDLIRVWFMPTGGHAWRQYDTLGMALRASIEFTSSFADWLAFLLFPKILQSGSLDGVNASEFPLLNFLTSPFWLLGGAKLGAVLSQLFVYLLNLSTAWFAFPRLCNLVGIKIDRVWAFLVFFSIGVIHETANQFLPESIALPLMVWSSVYLLIFAESGRIKPGLAAIFLGALSIASKPVLVVAPICFIVFALIDKRNFVCLRNLGIIFGLMCAFPVWWYGFHAHYLASAFEGPQIFLRAEFKPLTHLLEFDFSQLIRFLLGEFSFRHFPFFMGYVVVAILLFKREYRFLSLYGLAFFGAVSLSGKHAIVHNYYLVGVGIFGSLSVAQAVTTVVNLRRGLLVAQVIITVGVVWQFRNSEIAVAKAPVSTWAEAKQVSEWLVEKDVEIITDDRLYPEKLVQIGRVGLIGGADLEKECRSDEVRDRDLALVMKKGAPFPDCERKELHRFETSHWNVVLLQRPDRKQ